MDSSGCRSVFTETTLRRVLPTKTMALVERLRQADDLKAAEIDGLEHCPYCPYAMVIDNPEERLFQCMGSDCGQVTCRQCKKPNHLPKRCAEAAADAKLDARHAIEEAMAEALMRRCPKCHQPFIKEAGCNFMQVGSVLEANTSAPVEPSAVTSAGTRSSTMVILVEVYMRYRQT